MKKVQVIKSVDNKEIENFSVPVVFVKLLNSLTPNSGLSGMKEKGLDIQAILDAAQNNEAYQQQLSIVENGNETSVQIILQN